MKNIQNAARFGLRWGYEIQRFRQATYAELEQLISAISIKSGSFKIARDPLADNRQRIYVPNSRLIVGANEVMDDAQEELIKIWRYISGSSRQIQTLAVGSGFTDPTRSDTALTTPLASDDIESWDDTALTPDSTNLSLTKASKLWLSDEANGVISEIGLFFDNNDMVTHALFDKLSVNGASKANPCQIDFTAAHGLVTGDELHLDNLGGMVELNNRNFTVTYVDTDSVTLDGEDSTGHTTYTSGGNAWLIVVKSTGEVVETRYVLTLTS